jgi:Zn-dependent membrane protease YugP
MMISLILMLIIALPSLLAAAVVKMTFAKYARVGSRTGYTGAEAAAAMLQKYGIRDCRIEPVRGHMTDHYDPTSKTLRLSEPVYASQSLSAIGVACHEAGHAIQHAHGFAFLALRSVLVPATNLCSRLYFWVIIAAVVAGIPQLYWLGVAMLAMTVVFSVVTLPVEWDASRRAKIAMAEVGLLAPDETSAAGNVLNAAFLTYLAAAVSSIMTLLYYILAARD